jgi:hypothetical protein
VDRDLNNLPDMEFIDTTDLRFDFNKMYYLAGPMSGYPAYNFEEFEFFAAVMRSHGVKVASPHEIDHGETLATRGSLPYQVYLDAGIAMLETCQGIVLMPGWPQSSGACNELSRSIDLGMPVYFVYQPDEWTESVRLIDMNRRPPA